MQRRKQANIHTEDVSDTVLVAQALTGDHGDFEALVHRYHGLLIQCISNYLGDRDQANDVLQQVLLQLYMSLPTLTAGIPLKGWLLQVARNRCIDELRKRQRRREVYFSELEWYMEEDVSPLSVLPDPGPPPEECAEYHDLLRDLERATLGLSPTVRSVVLLRCAEQLPFSQIGQALHMPEGRARIYFYRGRARLRTTLATR